MTFGARQAVVFGPPPVAVHDDGDMPGKGGQVGSNLHDFFFLGRKHGVSLGDVVVRQFLDIVLSLA
jgi:hypothetical protein